MHVDVEQFGADCTDRVAESEMLAMSVITLISTAGIAFYVRFLVALCRERKSLRRIYSYCMRLDFDEAKAIDPVSELMTTRILNRRNNERIRN
jgi:hypothetical protein